MAETLYATAANFGGHEETRPMRPWVKEVTVPESIKRKYPSKHYVGYQACLDICNIDLKGHMQSTRLLNAVLRFLCIIPKLRASSSKYTMFGKSYQHHVVNKPEILA